MASSTFQHALPPYIRTTDFSTCAKADLDYLVAQEVFTTLPAELTSLVLDRYEKFVHPLSPCFILSDIRNAIETSCTQLPLMLYHAIMCAGLAAVETHHIIQHGWSSKAQARQSCYKKAKVVLGLGASFNANSSRFFST
jgi:hypothetical protein